MAYLRIRDLPSASILLGTEYFEIETADGANSYRVTLDQIIQAAGGGVNSGGSLLTGSGAPQAGDGNDGDLYIDLAVYDIYGPKAAGAWGVGTSLIGPEGPQGPQGIQGIQGPQGPAGSGGGAAAFTPVADFASGPEDTPISGNVLTNDTTITALHIREYRVNGMQQFYLPGQTADIPVVGSFIMYDDGEWEFTPAVNYNGTVPLIRYEASDGADVRLGSLVITINPVNDPPVANSNAGVTDINQSINLNVLQNDNDPEGSSLTITHINATSIAPLGSVAVTNGSVTLNANNTLTVTPALDYEGQITFTYTVSDGTLSSNGNVLVKVGYEDYALFSPVSPLLIGDVYDDAAYNFGLTAMRRHGVTWNNGVDVTSATYSASQGAFTLTQREPWLYDRATTIYTLYLRTGDTSIRDIALDLAEQYFAGVTITGDTADFVTGGGTADDPKYMYPIVAWWYEKETADPVYREKAEALYNNIIENQARVYTTDLALWTERNVAYSILACLAQYWITGDPVALGYAEDYFDMVAGMSTATGAPLHPHSQHEGSSILTPITSPWMGAFLVESLIQLYRTNGDTAILTWISNYCDFVIERGLYVNTEASYFLGLRTVAYLVGESIIYPSSGGPYDDGEHNYDIAVMLQKGAWAKQQLSLPVTTEYQNVINELLDVAESVFLYWTRTTAGYPRYRVNPPRKYAWWFRNAYSKVYAVTVPLPLQPINVVAPTVSGSAVQGETLTVNIGTWRGNPTPTYTYQWRRDGVAISGATSSTYVTTAPDVGTLITCSVTGTNVADAVTVVSSNSITVTPAGAPTITSQPSNSQVSPGANATFSITATGSPSPTYQWQISTNSGGSWSNIPGETSSSITLNAVTVGQNGYQYRCVATNVVSSVNSNAATLFVVSNISAVRFSSASQGARFLSAVFPNAGRDFTIEALVRFDAPRLSNDLVFESRYAAGRTATLQSDGVFEQYNLAVGDNQTGVTGGTFGSNPTQGVWYLLTLSGDGSDTGNWRGTMQEVSNAGATQFTATRLKGFANNLVHGGVAINGGGDSNGGFQTISFQYVRGYASQRDLTTIANARTSVDTTGALFWWVFKDNGSGGLTVIDATGNGRVPTLTGGTLVTDGPVMPQL